MHPEHLAAHVSDVQSPSAHQRRNCRSREQGYLRTPGNPSAILSGCCNLHQGSVHSHEHQDFNELEDALKIRSHSVATTLQSGPGIKIEVDDGWDEL